MSRTAGRPAGTTKVVSPLLKQYEAQVGSELRVLLAKKNLSQKQVAWALEKAGIKESPKGLSAKIKAGTFSAAYYLAIKNIIDSM